MTVNITSTSGNGYQGKYELTSLEQLFNLVNDRGQIIVREADHYQGGEPYGEYTLEIYDDYRE